MKRTFALGFCVLCTTAGMAAPRQVAESVEHLRERTFERVWQIVYERFYDPHFNGVDWRGAHDRYAPKVARVRQPQEFYDLLNQMLGELKQSHFWVYPPWEYDDRDSMATNARGPSANRLAGPAVGSPPGEAGMTVQVVEGRPVITRVEAASAAANAGLRPGFVVLKVGGMDLVEYLKKPAGTAGAPHDRLRDFADTVAGLLSGTVGDAVEAMVLDAENSARTVTLTLGALPGEPCSLGEMPTVYATMEARHLTEGIGYLRFNLFMMPLLDRITGALASFHGEKGVIIDLRGNPGGIGGIALPVAGHLVKKEMSLGTATMRSGETREWVYPQEPRFDGPVAILTDEGTASASELLAAGLQEYGRAVTVGRTTAGEVLPSVFERLPDGSRFQYAVALYRTPKGVVIEGRGVVPDFPVTLTRKALLSGIDPDLEKAIAIVKRKARGAKH